MDVSSIISQRLNAMRKLQENPNDNAAMTLMQNSQKNVSRGLGALMMMAVSNTYPFIDFRCPPGQPPSSRRANFWAAPVLIFYPPSNCSRGVIKLGPER